MTQESRHEPLADSVPPAEPVHGAHETYDKGELGTIGALVSDISNDLSTLMRQELALAKAELQQTASRAGKAGGMLAAAGVAGHLLLIFLSLAVMFLLADVFESLALGALIVAIIWAVAAAILAVMGRSQMKQIDGMPRTVDTAKRVPEALKGNEDPR